jgi:hypothetical protein
VPSFCERRKKGDRRCRGCPATHGTFPADHLSAKVQMPGQMRLSGGVVESLVPVANVRGEVAADEPGEAGSADASGSEEGCSSSSCSSETTGSSGHPAAVHSAALCGRRSHLPAAATGKEELAAVEVRPKRPRRGRLVERLELFE